MSFTNCSKCNCNPCRCNKPVEQCNTYKRNPCELNIRNICNRCRKMPCECNGGIGWLLTTVVAILLVLLIVGAIVILRDHRKEKICSPVYHEYDYQKIDGYGNTKLHDKYVGHANEVFPRYHTAIYSDPHGGPAGLYRPNPRHISNNVAYHDDDDDDLHIPDDETIDAHDPYGEDTSVASSSSSFRSLFRDKYPEDILDDDEWLDDEASWDDHYRRSRYNVIPNQRGLSSLVWLWGQTIDHDVTLTKTDSTDKMQWDITGDAVFDPEGHGRTFSISRSKFADDDDDYSTREQKNSVTSYIDGSFVYGSDDERSSKIRSFEHGRLITTAYNMPVFNTYNLENAPDTSSYFYLVGDIRGNEHLGLLAMHTIWLREHNYWADHYYHKYPTWNDEKLYQTARKRVIGEIQAITYNQFIPALLGRKLDNNCYDKDYPADPRMFNEVSSCAYRLGHTMVTELSDVRDVHTGKRKSYFELRELFFNINHYKNGSVLPEEVLLGYARQWAEEIDIKVVDSMRNTEVHGAILDLVSLNIARGRDHGLPDYNTLRWKIGGEPISGWHDITKDQKLIGKLLNAYGENGWRDLDPWVGMFCEDHYPGSSLGYTAHHIIKDQFQRLRDGDAYTYLWDKESEKYKDEIHATTLKDVLLRTTQIHDSLLKDNPFFV